VVDTAFIKKVRIMKRLVVTLNSRIKKLGIEKPGSAEIRAL